MSTPDGNMESFTLRLPPELRALAEARAKEHGCTLADELRKAITSHYGQPDGLVTFQDLKEAVRTHEQTFHSPAPTAAAYNPVVTPSPAPTSFLPPAKMNQKSVRSDNGFEYTLEECKIYLDGLLQMLQDGAVPTPADLAEKFGRPSRRIGRVLNICGVKAKNTRRNGISSRYYFPNHIETLKKAIKAIDSAINEG